MRTPACALLFAATLITASQPAPLTDAQMEAFLRTARVVQAREIGKGVTASVRATLSDGTLTHDAHIQTVDVAQAEFRGSGGIELNFRDSWHFNVAAYKIDRLLGLNLVPATVERNRKSTPASFTWWVDDVLMEEGERLKKKIPPPNVACWSEQTRLLRTFDQLIDNIDRNLGNTLITKSWRIWAIDHTRAFRYLKTPRKPQELTGVDRAVLARLTALDFPTLRRELDGHVTNADINNLLARRDAIIERFAKLGEVALYDRREPALGCLR